MQLTEKQYIIYFSFFNLGIFSKIQVYAKVINYFRTNKFYLIVLKNTPTNSTLQYNLSDF